MLFCTGMSVAISRESVSARMMVGPNTMARLVDCILLTAPFSTTLGGREGGRGREGITHTA